MKNILNEVSKLGTQMWGTGFFFVNGTHFAVSNLNYVPCTKPSLGGEGSRCITLLVLSPRVDCSSVIAMKKKMVDDLLVSFLILNASSDSQ